ncbi:hypothetical protein D3C85_787500 [compost metagenome]
MSIRLTWRNVNAAIADNIIIYRDTAPIPADTLPAPLVTLAADAVSYDDTTVVRGTVYYYRIAAVKGTDFVLTDNKIHGYFPDSGPGPQTLKRGDWKRGYFGRVLVGDFLNIAETRSVSGLTAGTAEPEAGLTHWHKYIYDGKILFIPNTSISNGLSWNAIYQAGLMYGTDNFGSPPTGGVASPPTFNVNQKRLATVKGYDFLIRAPKVSTLPTTQYITGDPQYADSEWLELICRTYLTTTRADIKGHWDDVTPKPVTRSVTQHFQSSTAAIIIAQANVDDLITYSAPTATMGWLPVFELQY